MLGRPKKQAKLPTATSKGLLNKVYLKDYPNKCIAVSKIKQSPKLKLIIHNTRCRKLGFKLSLDARPQIKPPLSPSKSSGISVMKRQVYFHPTSAVLCVTDFQQQC